MTTTTLAYDVFGNMIRLQSQFHALTRAAGGADDRLAQSTTHFAQDGAQVRAQWTDSSDRLTTSPTGGTQRVVRSSSTRGDVRRYVRGDGVDQIQGHIEGQHVALYLTDRQGSVRAVVTARGVVVQWEDYTAYGVVKATQTAAHVDVSRYATPFGYTGRETFEAVAGLQYNRARWYDATARRFITEDTAGFAAGDVNLYRYARNNPVNFTDPSGHFAIFGGAIGGLIGGIVGGINASINGQDFWEGAGKGALIGAIAGATGGLGLLGASSAIGAMGLGAAASTTLMVGAGMASAAIGDAVGQNVAMGLGWQKGGYNYSQTIGAAAGGGLGVGLGKLFGVGAKAATSGLNTVTSYAGAGFAGAGVAVVGDSIAQIGNVLDGKGWNWNRTFAAAGIGFGAGITARAGVGWINSNRGTGGWAGGLADTLGWGMPQVPNPTALRRAYLNEKFGRTGNLDLDINARGGNGSQLGEGTVRVFRVEGTPNARIAIGEGGSVAIADGEKMLFLNFGDRARAEAFLARRLEQGMPGATIKSFEVPRSLLQELRATAVTEAELAANPALRGRPLVVDTTKAPDQFGLRPEQIEALRRELIQGTGRKGP